MKVTLHSPKGTVDGQVPAFVTSVTFHTFCHHVISTRPLTQPYVRTGLGGYEEDVTHHCHHGQRDAARAHVRPYDCPLYLEKNQAKCVKNCRNT